MPGSHRHPGWPFWAPWLRAIFEFFGTYRAGANLQSSSGSWLKAAIRREQLEAGDPWWKVLEAAKAATAAARDQDRDALERAIGTPADAAKEIPSEPTAQDERAHLRSHQTQPRVHRFQRRGRLAARTEWRLMMSTHSLTKLYRHQLAAG
jgi:hypothetical protein